MTLYINLFSNLSSTNNSCMVTISTNYTKFSLFDFNIYSYIFINFCNNIYINNINFDASFLNTPVFKYYLCYGLFLENKVGLFDTYIWTFVSRPCANIYLLSPYVMYSLYLSIIVSVMSYLSQSTGAIFFFHL